MIRKRRVHLLIWLAVIAAGLVLPVLQVIEDRKSAQAIAVRAAIAAAAQQQQKANELFANNVRQSLLSLRRSIRNRAPTTQELQANLDLLGPGIAISPTTQPAGVGPSALGPTERYLVTRANPPAEASVTVGQFAQAVGMKYVAMPATVVGRNWSALGHSLHRWCGILWLGLYVLWILSPRRSKPMIAYAMLVIAVACLISTLGHLLHGWSGWLNGGGGIWLGITMASGVVQAYSYRLIARPDLRHCTKCGYDLWSNTSGICPECGIELTAAQKLYLYSAHHEWNELRGRVNPEHPGHRI